MSTLKEKHKNHQFIDSKKKKIIIVIKRLMLAIYYNSHRVDV